MNLPPAANRALVDLLGACRRYGRLADALSIVDSHAPSELAMNPQAMMELEAIVRDAEQALLAIFVAVLGEPNLAFPGDES